MSEIGGIFATVSMILLLPAISMAIVVLATAWSLRNLGTELVRLRLSLRRSGAAAVALSELDRETVAMGNRLASIRSDLSDRVHWPRPRHASPGR